MPGRSMQIISPDREKHGEAVIDLIGKVFSGWQGYFLCRDVWRNRLFWGKYDWDASRIGLIDGGVVTHWGVWGYDMRIGGAHVSVGGVGVVATHADYRKKGLMARTARASIDAMREMGYDMTMLFGIDDYYDKFGYVRAWSEVDYKAKIRDLPREKPDAALPRFALRQRDGVDRIYNRENSVFTGTAVRPTYIRDRDLIRHDGYLWRDRRGETVGYVVVVSEGESFCCSDHGGDVEQVLRAVARIGRQRGHKEVRFSGLSYDSPLCKRLRRGNCRAEIEFKKCGGAMINTLNLNSVLRKVSGELSRRLKRSHLADWRGEILVTDPRDKALLVIADSRVKVSDPKRTKHSIRGGEEIAQLIIGTDESDEIVESGRIRLTGDARELARVLFPNQHPTLAPWDWY